MTETIDQLINNCEVRIRELRETISDTNLSLEYELGSMAAYRKVKEIEEE